MAAPEALQRGVPLAEASVLCVFVHGRGQSPELMDEHALRRLPPGKTAFVLPRAPTGSWYDARAVDPLTSTTNRQLAASLDHLAATIAAAIAGVRTGTPLLLAGFSQGACVALELAMARGPWPGALACFTGCRVGVPADRRPATDLARLPVYLSGADADPWIPPAAFGDAAAELARARARLRADVFPGRPHEISDSEIDILAAMLGALAINPNGALW